MTPAEDKINRFLVKVFNDVLRLEEQSISNGKHKNLSVSEVHVLETVQNAAEGESMRQMADRLHITAGTFTTAVKTLEQKGFLTRTKHPEDKRRVTIALAPSALEALATHEDFHARLVGTVSQHLSEVEMEDLAGMLCSLGQFFDEL